MITCQQYVWIPSGLKFPHSNSKKKKSEKFQNHSHKFTSTYHMRIFFFDDFFGRRLSFSSYLSTDRVMLIGMLIFNTIFLSMLNNKCSFFSSILDLNKYAFHWLIQLYCISLYFNTINCIHMKYQMKFSIKCILKRMTNFRYEFKAHKCHVSSVLYYYQ